MASQFLIWRAIAGAWLALAASACAQTAALLEPIFPDSDSQSGAVTYRDLAGIPPRPAVAPPEMNEKAVDELTADRAAAAEAVDRLRRQPFAMPDPAPSSPGPQRP